MTHASHVIMVLSLFHIVSRASVKLVFSTCAISLQWLIFLPDSVTQVGAFDGCGAFAVGHKVTQLVAVGGRHVSAAAYAIRAIKYDNS